MSKMTKYILTIPCAIFFLYVLSFFFQETYFKIVGSFERDFMIATIARLLLLFTIIYLVVDVWKIKTIDKSKKWSWTCIIIFFGAIGSLIYIWKKEKELKQNNAK